jgi:uncharacterized protein (TIGR03435 family)
MKRRAMVACRIVSVLLVGVATLVARGPVAHATPQSPATPEKRFDVASVKPAPSPSELSDQRVAAATSGSAPAVSLYPGIRTLPGGRLMAASVNLRELIVRAFEVKDFQVDGGPKWLTTDYFGINATAGADATPAEINAMLKALLVERFALRTHTDTRQAPVYSLTVARSDRRLEAGLKPTTAECVRLLDERKNATGSPPPLPPIRSPTTPTCGVTFLMNGNGATRKVTIGGGEIKELTGQISGELAAPVIDRTELSGRFDIALAFTSERQIAGRTPGLDPNGTETPPPLIGAALEKQLGLKLEKKIGPLPILVIDGAEHPMPD